MPPAPSLTARAQLHPRPPAGGTEGDRKEFAEEAKSVLCLQTVLLTFAHSATVSDCFVSLLALQDCAGQAPISDHRTQMTLCFEISVVGLD